ncbi:23S rRNA (uracil(1939)-C(5))-methyltransferase [Solemya pervernicosa gill symbiont]|uniref:23S rRNA (uracil(1939)-C(5))-methyltransferase RlmD n=2 Tax=Gammaproteobacteria incertae sedis TaxID=118884 RepID=A0A1T2LAC5_9GAMM|nr:23S rRNA (uracil(1939)-C(5))-methyltransferase RlmD [Candidatus Reidiella endopervernicosa]OOZ42041.1 23S rRNA (uracil(1939)-C(5))-methyltransferase [Solemya pervernicosa gill symbiont]QKQ27013.1 23S rRNA (uracil(1939)-C(5))-methyltransferase RlmD [Candidatus Reidiella endopervernicosa]
MSRRRRRKIPQEPVEATIESMSHDGKGVAHLDGKALFIGGALPDERVMFKYSRLNRRFDEGNTVEVLEASPDRVEPKCLHAAICGGCTLQHMDSDAQISAKQQVLLDNFEHLGKVAAETILPPITGPVWGYRRKARLGVKDVVKKGKVLVGFREKGSPYLAELEQCEVLHPSVGLRLRELATLIEGMDTHNRIAQIEVAVSDSDTALVFRNLDPLSEGDHKKLLDYAQAQQLQAYLQPGGPDTVTPLWPEAPSLSYRLDAYDVEITFEPGDFTQVNHEINHQMIDRAIEMLELEPGERVLDLFCGLGNFTLPITRRAAAVVGVEGDATLVERAKANAERNGIENAEFHVADLADEHIDPPWLQGGFDKILLDPARAGALEVLPTLAKLGTKRIVYVSCNPATLARDAGELVHTHGFRLVSAGVMDMFPHTGHVESIALFTRD